MKSDSIVIIPTYNEKENIEKIIRAVFGLEKQFDILKFEEEAGTEELYKMKHSERSYINLYADEL